MSLDCRRKLDNSERTSLGAQGSNPRPFCCEVTVLTTTPQRWPKITPWNKIYCLFHAIVMETLKFQLFFFSDCNERVKLEPSLDHFAQTHDWINESTTTSSTTRLGRGENKTKKSFCVFFFWTYFLFNKINDYVYLGAGLQLNCKGQPTQADLNHRTTERGPVLFLLTGTIAAGRPESVCRWTSFISLSRSPASFFFNRLEYVLTFSFGQNVPYLSTND